MIIGFDLDGVLYPWHEIVLEYCKKSGFIDRSVNLKKLFNPFDSTNIFDNQFNSILRHNILHNPTLYDKAPIRKDYLRILNNLAKLTRIIYVTFRPFVEVTMHWMKYNKLPYYNDTFIVNGGPSGKVNVVKENNCLLYIDDRVDVAKVLSPITKVLLLNRPWNEDWKEEGNVVRIYSLDEIKNHLGGDNGY